MDEPVEQKEIELQVPTEEGPSETSIDFWVMYADGSSNFTKFGAGLILSGPEGAVVEYVLHFEFPATNNEVEYEALAAGLQIVRVGDTRPEDT